jgi:chromosome segregation ATPase
MSEVSPNTGETSTLSKILMAAGGIYVVVSIVLMVMLFGRIDDLKKDQATLQKDADHKIAESSSQTRASLDALRQQVGMTKQDLARRTASFQAKEKATETRLAADEEQTKQQIGAVSGEVTGVKTEVGKVQTDVTDTKNDLAATKTKLERAVGDLSKHSELIATNHDELEVLKHRGDRNYYEFTLNKGKDPVRLSTVSLQLKSTDSKKSKFTLYVLADDKKIEKKDRTINEPLQFYASKDRGLYEVVVNSVNKNTVSGYMSTPKTVVAGGPGATQAQ